jgi:hypothetical protein
MGALKLIACLFIGREVVDASRVLVSGVMGRFDELRKVQRVGSLENAAA